MASVLVLYATMEGQTARIAERIARELRGGAHAAHYTDWQGVERFAQAFAARV